ncbi:hypothetical protein Runsl_5607 [Runella slithyformis DSM 19594]|uniref:DUF5683 domain-containing protein n=2 Tax=Runella TaxID=105 RepID=A0A7U3ZR90_RUNSL|nr:hypothetical protein Runsl_5607 [Runella slithyformis DSM 19594]
MGQQVRRDSLQKRFSQLAVGIDTLRADSLKKVQALKDTLSKVINPTPKVKHSPRKAAMYSLAVPSLGQAYNKQYWKMPFVYAGFGTVIYFIRYFNIRYKDYLTPYIASFNPTTGAALRTEAPVYIRSQQITRTLTIDQITKGKDFYRRYRDLNIIMLTAVWALNVVEANVSAHLKTFDMSEDISFRVQPDAGYTAFTGGIIGAKIVIPIK